LHDAVALEGRQPLAEQRAGHARHAAVDLAEAAAAQVEVAEDQRGPALREHLGALATGQYRP